MFESFDSLIEQKLLNLHTAFVAKVISVVIDTKTGEVIRKIQPLNMIKMYGEKEREQSVIENVPILKHVGEVKKGDLVFCVCAERNITEAKKGKMTCPPIGRHSINDAVIIGVIIP